MGTTRTPAVSFNSFFWAIAMQESGGSYKAVNGGSGALGKYQIMPFNVGPWSKKYFGSAWSPSQFLNDPRKQDALAFAVLSDYFQKWGARGAASAWYSGNPALANSYRSQSGGPSIGAYVDQVLAKATRAPGSAAATKVYGTPDAVSGSEIQPKQTVVDTSKKTNPLLDELSKEYPGSGVVSAPGVQPMSFKGDEVASGGVQQMVDKAGAMGEATTEWQPLTPVSVEQSAPTDLPATQVGQSATSPGPDMGSGGGGSGWAWQMKTVQSKFPGLKMTSGFRPGSITSSGNVSWHAKGRAVDLPASMAVFNWIRANYGATSKELIFTPAGKKQIKNGKGFVYSGKVVPDHVDHIHWAF